ncbi:hypothetical protein [uncultured Cyclobacterium sp.]|uniref:hypothetical protein n=1 Tax=uncultured Cyclobacterium sp. TaxID=453820 RepID=UPI0030ECD88C
MKILFISWDSDQTNYMENLFFPIFEGLQKEMDCQFFVLQFSWADAAEVNRIANIAEGLKINYQQQQVRRKPHPILGTLLTTQLGQIAIKRMVIKYGITHLMPRSTMPAMMVNSIFKWAKNRGIKIVFDADGLPIQERVDYAGLKESSLQFQWLKKTETKLLKLSDIVLVRSTLAIYEHLKNIGQTHKPKFFKVSNGRIKNRFKPNPVIREKIREDLNIMPESILWLYSGGIGPQYLVGEMLQLFETYHIRHPESKFLFLIRNATSLAEAIPNHLKQAILIKTVNYEDLPAYYAAADLGVSLRKPAPSLAGIAPIKVSEYLLAGLPIICSKGIGDLDEMIGEEPYCFIYPPIDKMDLIKWLKDVKEISREQIRAQSIPSFALENSINEYKHALKSSNL